MLAKADTNCHNILNFVSATWTHWAKIGVTRCVVADMSATFPDKTIASSGFFLGGCLRVPTRHCDLVVPADGGWGRSN